MIILLEYDVTNAVQFSLNLIKCPFFFAFTVFGSFYLFSRRSDI